MSLDATKYRERVFLRVSGGMPQVQTGILRSAIQATMGDALYEFCMVSLTQPWRAHLEADYALSLTAGVADFSAQTALLADSIVACNKITHSSVVGPGTLLLPFHIKGSREAMHFAAADSASIFGYAYVTKTSVEAVFQGAALTGTLNVRGISVPAIGSVPVVIEPQLIDVGARLAIAKVAGMGQAVQA